MHTINSVISASASEKPYFLICKIWDSLFMYTPYIFLHSLLIFRRTNLRGAQVFWFWCTLFFCCFFYQLTILIPSYMVFGTSSVRLDIIHRHLSYLIEELILSGFRGQEICIYICLHLVVLLSCVKKMGRISEFFVVFVGGMF